MSVSELKNTAVDITVYLTSKEADAVTGITIGSARKLPSSEAEIESSVQDSIAALNAMMKVSDFRLMTFDEITEYKAENQ